MANLPYKIVRILNEVRRSADQSINDLDKKIEHLSIKYEQVMQENAKIQKEVQETIKSMQTNQPLAKADNSAMETRARKRTGSVAQYKTRESRSRSKVRSKGTRRRSRSAFGMKSKRRKVAKRRSKRGKSRRRNHLK